MAYAQRIITSNSAGDQEFTFTFDYIKEEHIKVFVNFVQINQGTGSNEFQVITNTTPKKISLNTGLASNNTRVEIRRVSSLATPLVDFEDGSTLTATDLDTAEKQSLFIDQELDDALKQGVSIDESTGLPSLTNQRLSNVADPVNAQDVVTKNYLERNSSVSSGMIASNAVTADKIGSGQVTETKVSSNAITQTKIANNAVIVDKIAPDAVNGTKIADDSINSEHYVDGSIDTAHIADAQITADKLQDGSVTSTKLGTDSVVEAKIVDANVTAAKLANNSVQTAKIADGAVQTAKIADTAITETKIGNAQITPAKLANNAVTNDKIADAELKTLAGMQSGTASKLADSTILTSDIADLNQLDGMQKATTITDDDTKFPTSGAIVDYVAAQLAPIGGLEAIANESSFPNTQPASGVVISIADAGGMAVSSTGTASGQTVGGTTVNISGIATNFRGSSVAAGVRFLVVSTGAGQNYTYHKATLKEDDLVGLSGDINDFAERYRVGSSFPTTNNDSGDLFWHTTLLKLYVYNGGTSAWEETQSIGNFFISTLSPAFDGSTQNFTITNAPTSAQQILLIVEGVLQKPNSGTSTPTEGFALDGSTIKLAAAPATGASYFAIVMGSAVNTGTPSNNTVTTAILQNSSVTTAKLGSSAVTTAKLANDAVTADKIGSGQVTETKIATNAITQTKIADNAVIVDKLPDNVIVAAKIAADAVNGSKIADDSIDSEHYVDGSIDTAHIADDAVTADKLANSINSAIAANTAKDLTALSASNLTSGTVPDARFPATLPAISGANLTNLPAGGKATNLVINGAMNLAQRGTSSTSQGYQTVDRWRIDQDSGLTEACTQSQVALSSSDTPYTSGFRYAFRITNGNQTSQDANDYIQLVQKIEAQDLAQSGWNYTSDSSNITLSFWVKASIAQTFYVKIEATDANRTYTFPIAVTTSWQKLTKTIPGNSNLVVNNDTGVGMRICIIPYYGTNYTTSGHTVNTWIASDGANQTPDFATTWFSGNDATFDVTGVLLEVADSASDFPHETHDETLQKCKRYCHVLASASYHFLGLGMQYYSGTMFIDAGPIDMRNTPTMVAKSGSSGAYVYEKLFGNSAQYIHQIALDGKTTKHHAVLSMSGDNTRHGQVVRCSAHSATLNNNEPFVYLDAEL